MGIVNFSIPKSTVLRLCQFKPIDNFVETGTYKGETSFWAARYFKKVYTIEIDEKIAHETSSRQDRPENLEFFVGNSKDLLPELMAKKIKGSCFFWLDGHWCFGAGGKEEECPLLFELEAIKSFQDSIIFIDDARCFLGPLPPPHDSSHWPRIDQIFDLTRSLFPKHRFTIQDDVIMIVPEEYMKALDEEWQGSFNQRFFGKGKSGIFARMKKAMRFW